VLSSVLMSWQNQYNLNHSTVPKSTCTLLPDQRPSSKSWLRSKARTSRQKERAVQPHPKPRVTQSARRLGARLVESLRGIAMRMFCQSCKAHGNSLQIHNTLDFCCYDSNGKPLVAAAGKPSESKKPYKKSGGGKGIVLVITVTN
jgi:hypothetical protein